MKRILIIGFYDKRGGIETSVMNYYRNMNHEKIQYDFINPYENFYFEDEIKSLGGKVHKVSGFDKPVRYIRDVINVIRQGRYDIVNIEMLSALNIYPIIAAKMAAVEHIIVHSHNSGMGGGTVKRLVHHINKIFINTVADVRWACSKTAADWMFYRGARIVNNAIDLEKYIYNAHSRRKIRREFKIGNEFVIGTVGRLMPEKNHKFLIEVIFEILKKDPTAKLLIVGDGPCMQELKLLARSRGVEDNVILAGDRSDTALVYSAMDVFVLPSYFEGLPMVGIEAQASGLPCVLSDAITDELKVTEVVNYLPLELLAAEWAQHIMSNKTRLTNKESTRALNESGYNIKLEAKKLENFYLSLN